MFTAKVWRPNFRVTLLIHPLSSLTLLKSPSFLITKEKVLVENFLVPSESYKQLKQCHFDCRVLLIRLPLELDLKSLGGSSETPRVP